MIKFQIRDFDVKVTKMASLIDILYSILVGFEKSSILKNNPYESFSKPFLDNKIFFYINGYGERNYFHDLHDRLLQAEK